MRTHRLAAATGAIYVVAILTGDTLAQPASGAGEALLADLQAGRTATQSIGVALEVLAFAALLVFLGYLYRVLRRAEEPDGWAAAGALGAGLVTVAIKLGSIVPVMAAFHRADGLSPELATTLDDMGGAAFVVSGYTSGIFVALAALAAFSSGVLPRWLAVAGLVVGVVTVAAGAAGILDPAGYVPIPFLLGLAWVLVTSVLLAVRAPRADVRRVGDHVPAEAPASA